MMELGLSTPWCSLSAIASVCFGLFAVYFVVTTYIEYRRLAHIKGPWIASVSPFWLFYHTCKGDMPMACHNAIRKYGSPLRVGPDTIVTASPTDQRTMATTKSPFQRGRFFKAMKLDPRVDNLLSVLDEQKHAEMRKRLIPGYTGAEVPTLETDIDARVVELIDLIQREYVSKEASFDFAMLSAYFTIDILTQIAFGDALGYLTENKDLFGYIKSGMDFFPILELMLNHPTIFAILKSPIMSSAEPKPTDKIGYGAILGHTQKVIAQRFGDNPKVRQDMLGSFIKNGLTEVECQSESLLQLVAGADSTSTALRTTMLYLLTCPYAYGKLVKEISDTVEAGGASLPVIKNSEAQRLPYLRAVIMEGLRMYMPLQGLGCRIPPKGGIDLNGVFVPEGTQIGIATFAMLRREDLFGKDADTFRPERWIEGDPASIATMEKHHELIFGTGRSSCLGKNIALIELRKAFFQLLKSYDLTLVNAFKPLDHRTNGVAIQKNMFVRAYPRRL